MDTVKLGSNEFLCRPRKCTDWLRLSTSAHDISARCQSMPLYECSLHVCSHYNYSYSPMASLASNNLYGTIPASLTNISFFDDEIQLNNNELTGTLPNEFGSITWASWSMDLSSNLLTGPIPKFLSSIRGVEKLELGYNDFTGTVPKSLGSFNGSALTYLDLRGNALTGYLPTSICSLGQALLWRTSWMKFGNGK